MKKTQQQKEYENFIWGRKDLCYSSKKEMSIALCKRKPNNEYENEYTQFGFECWQESARIERDHAKG